METIWEWEHIIHQAKYDWLSMKNNNEGRIWGREIRNLADPVNAVWIMGIGKEKSLIRFGTQTNMRHPRIDLIVSEVGVAERGDGRLPADPTLPHPSS